MQPLNEFLPGWRKTPSRQAILDFVAAVTDETGPSYVSPAERIAVFDNDGTLWCEKPMYVQMDFLLRKLAEAARADPARQTQQPWQAAWEQTRLAISLYRVEVAILCAGLPRIYTGFHVSG